MVGQPEGGCPDFVFDKFHFLDSHATLLIRRGTSGHGVFIRVRGSGEHPMIIDRRAGIPLDPAWIGPPRGTNLHNPTIWLFVASAGLYAASIWLYRSDCAPYALFLALNCLSLYLAYTVMHEGVHGCLHRNRIVLATLSRICGAMLVFSYPLFRAVHLAHHREPNTPADPDAIVSRPRVLGALLGGFLIYFNYYIVFYRKLGWRDRASLVEAAVTHLAQITLIIIAVVQGWFMALFFASFVPLLITLWFLVLFFDFVPHHPHDSADRYHSTRAYGGRLLNLVLLGQNFHLIHHLWPRIPWFLYQRVFRQTRAQLIKHGCRIGRQTETEPTSRS
jgi:beta-carotene hydroxylase